MNAIRIRRKKEKKILGYRAINYIYLIILSCCLIVVNNLHPCEDSASYNEGKNEMLYIFHDFNGNQHILNESAHGSANSWEYLFDDTIPDSIKEEDGVLEINLSQISDKTVIDLQSGYNTDSIEDITETSIQDSNSIKDNQISIDEIMNELNIDDKISENNGSYGENVQETDFTIKSEFKKDNNSDYEYIDQSNQAQDIIIYGDDIQLSNGDGFYAVTENSSDGTEMVIERIDNDSDKSGKEIKDSRLDDDFTGASFRFLDNGLILPTLIPWENINFLGYDEYNSNKNNNYNNFGDLSDDNEKLGQGINIIDEYSDCMTPWGYKILHGESILAYQQLDSAPNVCNIERRFCWNGKLSGTYSQQGCSVNNNYKYETQGEVNVVHNEEIIRGETKQNSDGTVTVVKKEIGTDFLYNRPSNTYTYDIDANKVEKIIEDVDQTERVHWDCTTPRGEKVIHGQFIYAYKHANGFSDSPCEMQIRLCSMGDLNGTYTNSNCKTRDTSFIDWINGSPTWDTYSKEKLNWVKEQIKSEKNYDKEYGRITDSDALDRILYILEK